MQAFARGLTHPRWLMVLPTGDVRVAESKAPKRAQDASGLHLPFGMALVGDSLYVANTDAVLRLPCAAADLVARARMPEGP